MLADGPIKDPMDLKGKKIGVMSMGASRTLDGYAMAQAAGLDPKTDVAMAAGRASACRPRSRCNAAMCRRLRCGTSPTPTWKPTAFKLRYFTFPFQKDIFGYVYATTDEKLASRRADIIKVDSLGQPKRRSSSARTSKPRPASS